MNYQYGHDDARAQPHYGNGDRSRHHPHMQVSIALRADIDSSMLSF